MTAMFDKGVGIYISDSGNHTNRTVIRWALDGRYDELIKKSKDFSHFEYKVQLDQE